MVLMDRNKVCWNCWEQERRLFVNGVIFFEPVNDWAQKIILIYMINYVG